MIELTLTKLWKSTVDEFLGRPIQQNIQERTFQVNKIVAFWTAIVVLKMNHYAAFADCLETENLIK